MGSLSVIWVLVLMVVSMGAGVVWGVSVWRRRERLLRLEGKVVELEEALVRKRHTNVTDGGILDSLADITRVEFNLAEMEARVRTSLRAIEQARARLGAVREGPYGYREEDFE